MSEVSTDSLFHYTKDLDCLLGIIQNGFRMSYCFEDFDEEVSHFDEDEYLPLMRIIGSQEPRWGIAIPMICFCDIPLLHTKEHRKHYGSYCIGLNKDSFFEQYGAAINPVFYVSNKSWTKDILPQLVSIKKKIRRLKNSGNPLDTTLYHDMLFYTRAIISLTKPYFGLDTKGREKRFYDEREWRITFNLDDDKGSPDLIYGLTLEEYNAEKSAMNQKIKEQYMKLMSGTAKDVITHIIVPKESDIKVFSERLRKLTVIMGDMITNDNKQILQTLIDKTTSFERIEGESLK